MNIIFAIGSIGTFLAAIIALGTLLEIKKQRRSDQKPQIIFSKNVAAANLEILKSHKGVPIKWIGEEKEFSDRIFFEMINAGKEVAKNLITEYKLDTDFIANLLIKYDKGNDFDINYTSNWISYKSKSGSIDYKVFRVINQGEYKSLGYLLPRAIQSKPSGFAIPEEYLIYISIFVYLALKYNDPTILGKIPKLYHGLRFEDISGHTYNLYQTIEFIELNQGRFHFILRDISAQEYKHFNRSNKPKANE